MEGRAVRWHSTAQEILTEPHSTAQESKSSEAPLHTAQEILTGSPNKQ